MMMGKSTSQNALYSAIAVSGGINLPPKSSHSFGLGLLYRLVSAQSHTMQTPDPPRVATPNHVKRFAWLLACILVGLVIAVIGNSLWENSAWALAIPAVVAIGWLFLANPTECKPPSRQKAKSATDDETAP